MFLKYASDLAKCAQNALRCDICKENIVQNYCDFCHVNLCKPCIGEHISDEYDKHKVVSFQERRKTLIFPKCNLHSPKKCYLQCKSCNLVICVLCIASDEHKGHDFIVLEHIYNTKKEDMYEYVKEIENVIAPTYGEIRNEMINQIARLDSEYEKITTVMSEQAEKWHTEVERVINKIKNQITEIKEKHRRLLEKTLNEIKQIESLIKGNLSILKELEKSNDVSVVVEYRSRNKEFYEFPPKVHVTLPTFCPKPINGEQVYEMFGSLKPLVSTTDAYGYKMKLPEVSFRELLDIPMVINRFNTGYKDLRCISFYSEEEIWTSAEIGDVKCFSTGSKCMKTITTNSGEWPGDIAVTNDGNLVYCDWKLNTLNKIQGGKIEEIIRLQGWIPINLCITSYGELIVALCNDNKTLSKVVRYSGSTEKQIIQFDDEGKPLYSGNYHIKYINVNRNHDICVADCKVGAIVVVNQAGKLRWKYHGHSSWANVNLFDPHGITSNSQSQILTADKSNHCIHILDKDGQFLRYIKYVKYPHGVCVDKLDNLYMTEYFTGNVKVIRYLK